MVHVYGQDVGDDIGTSRISLVCGRLIPFGVWVHTFCSLFMFLMFIEMHQTSKTSFRWCYVRIPHRLLNVVRFDFGFVLRYSLYLLPGTPTMAIEISSL